MCFSVFPSPNYLRFLGVFCSQSFLLELFFGVAFWIEFYIVIKPLKYLNLKSISVLSIPHFRIVKKMKKHRPRTFKVNLNQTPVSSTYFSSKNYIILHMNKRPIPFCNTSNITKYIVDMCLYTEQIQIHSLRKK